MPAEEAILPIDQRMPQPKAKRGIAPIWHTAVLIAAIVGISSLGAGRLDNPSHDPARLPHYAISAGMELILVAYVFLGLRLRRIPFRSLFGAIPRGLNNITKEAGIAILFWLF